MSNYYKVRVYIRNSINVVIVCFVFHLNEVNAQEMVQKGHIFFLEEPSSKKHIEIHLSKPQLGRTALNFQHVDGEEKITLNEDVNDIQIGDIDNDGEDEIVVITKTNLSVLEKKNGRYTITQEKTTPLFGPNRKGKSSILSPSLSWLSREPNYVSEEDQIGGSVAIGDLNNDGKNEIAIIRPLVYNPDPIGPFKTYYSTVDILSWRDGYFEVIDNISRIFASGEEGIYILDIDKDNHNELIIATSGNSLVVYGYVSDSKRYRGQNKNFWVTGKIRVKGWIFLGVNKSQDIAQRTAIKTINNKTILIRCTLAVSSGSTEEVGKIRFFYMDPNVLAPLKSGHEMLKSEGKVPWIYTKDFKEIRPPIQLPIEKFENRYPYVKLQRLAITRYKDNINVVANMEDQTRVYKKIYKMEKLNNQNLFKIK